MKRILIILIFLLSTSVVQAQSHCRQIYSKMVSAPSEVAASVGVTAAIHSTAISNLIPILKSKHLKTKETLLKEAGGALAPPRHPSDIYRYSKIFLALIGKRHVGKSVDYKHFFSSAGNPVDTNAILVFSRNLLNRNDYHLNVSETWLYGHYEKGLSAEVIFPIKNEKPTDLDKPDFQSYTRMLSSIQGKSFDSVFSEGWGPTFKNLLGHWNNGGLQNPIVAQLIARLSIQYHATHWDSALVDLMSERTLKSEATRFEELLKKAVDPTPKEIDSSVMNEIAIRQGALDLSQLVAIWVAPNRRSEVVRELEKLGAPESVNSNWRGKTWSDVVLSPLTYNISLSRSLCCPPGA